MIALPFRLADMSDPLEYDGNQRRDFWVVMAGRAARGHDYGKYALEARAVWQDKLRRRERA